MARKKSLEAVGRSLRDRRENTNTILFSEVIVLMAGDYGQTLPVIPRPTPADKLDACLAFSNLWHHLERFRLTIKVRVHRNRGPEADFVNSF